MAAYFAYSGGTRSVIPNAPDRAFRCDPIAVSERPDQSFRTTRSVIPGNPIARSDGPDHGFRDPISESGAPDRG